MEATILERITIKPDVCNGKSTIRGMRITVETIFAVFISWRFCGNYFRSVSIS